MIAFDNFRPEPGLPIYLQILRYIKRGLVSGRIQDGEELPSRRLLSALLGVNPNTVQKAYRLLEEEGLILSHAGARSCICLNEEKLAAIRRELLEAEAARALLGLREMGLSKGELLSLIERYYDQEENE